MYQTLFNHLALKISRRKLKLKVLSKKEKKSFFLKQIKKIIKTLNTKSSSISNNSKYE